MTLSDPQVWTLIGVFAAAVLGGMTLMTTQFSRVIRAEIKGVEARIGGLEARIDAKIDALAMRIGALEHKVDDLDKEVTNLATRFWRSQ